MLLHYISRVEFVITFYLMNLVFSTVLEAFYMLHVSYCFILSYFIPEWKRNKVSVPFIFFLSLSCVWDSNLHTCTFNVLMPVGLHCLMM